MASTEQVLQPIAFALHTREPEQEDYQWYPETGTPVLARTLRDFHRSLLADLDAKLASPSTFLLFDDGGRIGLIVANLKTERHDHMKRRFDDTLLLEFESNQRTAVYMLAAGLLGPSSAQIQQRFLAYAEEHFQQKDVNLALPAVRVQIPMKRGGSDDLPEHHHVALRANEANCRRVAALLEYAADEPGYLGRGVLIVSTGYAGKDRLQQVVPLVPRLIALTRASSIAEEDATDLTPLGEKKNSPRLLATAGIGLLLAFGMLGIMWVISSVTPSQKSADKSNGSNNELNNSKGTTRNSGSGSTSSKERSDGKSGSDFQRGVSQAVEIVGLGAAPHGQGGFAVAACLAPESGIVPRSGE